MWKFLAAPLLAVLIAAGSGQAMSQPAGHVNLTQHIEPGLVLASHKRRHHRHHHHYNHHNHYNYYYPSYRYSYRPYCGWGDGFGFEPYGCFGPGYGYYLGGFYGGYYNYGYHPRRVRVSGNSHVKWCKARYRTYNARTDTFTGKGGRKYRCNSPYDNRR